MITLERLKEVQAQAEAAKVRVAEADALDAAVQLMEDFQVASPFCMVVATSISSVPPASQKKIWNNKAEAACSSYLSSPAGCRGYNDKNRAFAELPPLLSDILSSLQMQVPSIFSQPEQAEMCGCAGALPCADKDKANHGRAGEAGRGS